MAASDESPLTRLASRKGPDGRPFLAAHEVAAGERLRVDFTRGGLLPSVTQRWDDAPRTGARSGPADVSDAVLDCRRRVELAMRAVGPELSGVLLDVCCFLKGTERVEAERQWPARSAKLMLKTGLAALARHYGLVHAAGGGQGGIRTWTKG